MCDCVRNTAHRSELPVPNTHCRKCIAAKGAINREVTPSLGRLRLVRIDTESFDRDRHFYFGIMMAVKPPPGAMAIGSDVLGFTVFTSNRIALGSSSFMEPSR